MNNINFDIPFYIFEETINYIKLREQGNNKVSRLENLKSLLNLAKLNDRLSQNQIDMIIKLID